MNKQDISSKTIRKPDITGTASRLCKFWRSAALATMLSLPLASPAQAAAWCDGNVSHMLTDRSGALLVLTSFRGDWLQLCSLNVDWKGVSPTTCTSWLATVTTSMASGKSVTIQYPDPIGTCSAIPVYSEAPSPNYVSLIR